MATRSMGDGSRVGLIFTVFLLTRVKARLLISWFNWIKFSLDLTSHIQTPTYDSISPSHPQLLLLLVLRTFSEISSRGVWRLSGDRVACMCTGTRWRVCARARMGCVPNGLVIPGSECQGTWGIRPPFPSFTRRHRLRSNSEQAQGKAEGLRTSSRWEGPRRGGAGRRASQLGADLGRLGRTSRKFRPRGDGVPRTSALDLTGNLLEAQWHKKWPG